jgi:hypothetical protein
MTHGALFVAVFLACLVEAVEATTMALAAGTARDWRSATAGLLIAMGVLAGPDLRGRTRDRARRVANRPRIGHRLVCICAGVQGSLARRARGGLHHLGRTDVPAWWIVPATVVLAFTASLSRVVRLRKKGTA